MSAFEVTVTPTRTKNVKKLSEARVPTLVTLGPFTPKAIVAFEDIPITKTARRTVIFKNPFDSEIKLLLTKIPKQENNLTLEWTSNTIENGGEVSLEIVWNPIKMTKCTDLIQVTDSGGNRKEVSIILKTVELKKPPKQMTKRLKLKSPSPPKAILRRSVLQRKTNKPESPKPNVLKPNHLANIFNTDSFNFSKMDVVENLRIERRNKENRSPITPPNASNLFNNIKFTPATETKSHINIDLADQPTPVGVFRRDQFIFNENSVRKRLSVSPEVKFISKLASKKTPDLLTPPRLFHEVQVVPFDPACCSTGTKNALIAMEASEAESKRQLFNLSESSFGTERLSSETYVKCDGSPAVGLAKDAVSPCNEIQIVFLEQLLSGVPLNKTHSVSCNSTSGLSMIAEEQTEDMGTTYLTGHHDKSLQKTFKISRDDLKAHSDDSIVKNLTQDIKDDHQKSMMQHKIVSESLVDLSRDNPNDYQSNLKSNQGSMPDLDRRAAPGFLEQNRYFINKKEGIIFKENEIRAQSSCLNLNEVGVRMETQKRSYQSPKRESGTMQISPPKRTKFSTKVNDAAKQFRGNCWNAKQTKKLILKRPSSSPLQRPVEAERIILYDSELHLKAVINPDPFAATTTCDPFLASTMYLDERAIDTIEKQFKKWLNALVTIPADLDAESNQKLDVGKLFNEVRNKELTLAPTKELISSNYYKNRLNSLRSAGIAMYTSEEVSMPLRKIAVQVEKKLMHLRDDRNLHLDLVLQRSILELMLCFNPMWLRLGLEVTFGEQIDLQSNRDVIGLSSFIINRMFKDRYLEAKYSKAYIYSSSYSDQIKKFTFKKFLCLLLFLDTAKNKKLIKHNPCLFVKNAPYKETREILARFSSHLIANVGDITKHLRRLGYNLTHKQVYLDEFDYAFKNLAVDLRDGIRLTRVMEIILLRDDLSVLLRVPAISRLQKVYNVDLGLKALADADYQIAGDITAKDIADGHREKTLSLLWQIINKFRAPKFNAAAAAIQMWWRKIWLKVVINRRIQYKFEMRQNIAATKIQAAYRGFITRKYVTMFKVQIINHCIIVQKNVRRFLAQKRYAHQYSSIIKIQRWWRCTQSTRVIRREFRSMRYSAIVIQDWYRRRLFSQKLKAAAHCIRILKCEAKLRHEKAIVIQRALKSFTLRRKFRGIVEGIVNFNRRSALKYRSAAKLQSFMRMKKCRKEFLEIRNSALVIQTKWRQYLSMKKQRDFYHELRQSTIVIQQHFRAFILMKSQRSLYLATRQKIIFIQQKFIANRHMKIEKKRYTALRKVTINIQRKFRALIKMRKEKESYLKLKSTVILIQQKFRANSMMKIERNQYLTLKSAAIAIQTRRRAQILMKNEQQTYCNLKSKTIIIQRKFRATQLMKIHRLSFFTLQYNVTLVQRQFRANVMMKQRRCEFLKLKQSAILVQRQFRANLAMKQQRFYFSQLKTSTIKIQRKWRATVQMRQKYLEFLKKKKSSNSIQRYFRGYVEMKKTRHQFQILKLSVIFLQRKFRANVAMKNDRANYLRLRSAAILLQNRFRANRLMKLSNQQYTAQKKAAASIQSYFRGYMQMKKDREFYSKIRLASIKIQISFRAVQLMKIERQKFMTLKTCTILIQQRFRANLWMKIDREQYLKKKLAAIKIQHLWRATLSMRKEQQKYNNLKMAAVIFQQRFRAKIASRTDRENYLKLKQVTTFIQQKYRAYKSMEKACGSFLNLKSATIVIQEHFRAYLAMKSQKQQYLMMKKSTIAIQTQYRSVIKMRVQRSQYLMQKKSAICIQKYFRGYLLTKKIQGDYQKLREACILIQRKCRAQIWMRRQRKVYLRQKEAISVIQVRLRAQIAMRIVRSQYWLIIKSVRIIQTRFRCYQVMNETQQKYIIMKNAAICIQQKYRATIMMQYQRQLYVNMKSMTLRLQALTRGYLARRSFQAKLTPEYLEARRKQKAAKQIQAFWRGYVHRKRKQTKSMREISKRLREQRRNVDPAKTLGQQLKTSTNFLKGRFNIAEATSALQKLQNISRTVPHLLIDHAEFIATFCYGMMAQSIRSECDKLLIEMCGCIILNLARYEHTKVAAFQKDGLVTVAQMLLRWCDKDCGIFNTLCTLIWIFSHCSDKKNNIREYVMTHEAIYMLRETKKLVLRKENMRRNVKKPFGNFQLPDPKLMKQYPSMEPDYGIIKNKPYVFYSSVFAFDVILNRLNVDIS